MQVPLWFALLGWFGCFLSYLWGHHRARWQRARSDYNTLRASVPKARKLKWRLFWGMAGLTVIAWLWYAVMGVPTPVADMFKAPPSASPVPAQVPSPRHS